MTDSGHIIYNGRFIDANLPIIDIGNRSFRYGDGLFESIRMVDYNIPLLQDHLNRLNESATILKLGISKDLESSKLEEMIANLCDKNGLNGQARIGLNVFRSGKGWYAPEENNAEYTITAQNISLPWPIQNEQLSVGIFDEHKKPLEPLSSLKLSSAMTYVMAGIYRKEKGLDEVVICNTEGRPIEGSSSNLFLVFNETIFTPPVEEGCVNGVFRKYLLGQLTKLDMRIQIEPMNVEQLLGADEVFLTNALRGIQSVKNIGDVLYDNQITMKLGRQLIFET